MNSKTVTADFGLTTYGGAAQCSALRVSDVDAKCDVIRALITSAAAAARIVGVSGFKR